MNYNMDAINEHRLYIADLQAQIDAANARIAQLEAAQRKAHELKYYIGNPPAWQNYDEGVSEAIREAVNIIGKAQ